MNMELYQRWLVDAKAALTATQYTDDQAENILDFFRHIKGSAERELIGIDRMDAYMIYSQLDDISDFSVYNSMMCRMWMYAPYILRDVGSYSGTKWELEETLKREQQRKDYLESYHRG